MNLNNLNYSFNHFKIWNKTF